MCARHGWRNQCRILPAGHPFTELCVLITTSKAGTAALTARLEGASLMRLLATEAALVCVNLASSPTRVCCHQKAEKSSKKKHAMTF
ncbi:hypothetical protein ElyMa_005860300 [Elysia marginata]|uniref:Uncharacterized protein n=1 Tax=Elysia marginata TaxID=1093978 RepID=A0AAV4G009_9GAST|nr:hypothetical protein ElyMa_005860300 [Elysia marginata]